MTYTIALIKGDGIGPEIIAAATDVLTQVGQLYGHMFLFESFLAGGCAIDATGQPLPDATIEGCRRSDSVLLGAVGGPKWDTLPGHLRPECALLGLRSALGLYANLRPARLYAPLAAASPLKERILQQGLDLLIVRELTGGLYFGRRGRSETSAFDTEEYSVREIERIGHVAFSYARQRCGHVTSVDKANVLESSRLWREVMGDLHRRDYGDVSYEDMLVDNAAMQLIRNPSRFDVLVTSNLFGDILSDEAAELTGSIGILPSASLGDNRFGLYEPIHGSAPDIAGCDRANPIATILSAAMMLRHSFDLPREAAAIERAVLQVLESGIFTADINRTDGSESVGTQEMTRLICAALR